MLSKSETFDMCVKNTLAYLKRKSLKSTDKIYPIRIINEVTYFLFIRFLENLEIGNSAKLYSTYIQILNEYRIDNEDAHYMLSAIKLIDKDEIFRVFNIFALIDYIYKLKKYIACSEYEPLANYLQLHFKKGDVIMVQYIRFSLKTI